MSRFSNLAVIVAAGLAAGACAPTTGGLTAENNPGLNSVHQPVVQRTDFVLDLANPGGGLAPSELERLDAWLASIGARYGNRIAIDEPAGYSDPAAREDIARVAADHGLVLADAAPILAGTPQPGSVRVIVSRATAEVPGCPLWSDKGIGPSVNTSSNYGCAVNSNLAAMVANPEDLVLGQDASGNGSATTATRAIRSYREAPPTGRQGLPATTTTGSEN